MNRRLGSKTVIGAGLMGHGIAQIFASRPGVVRLYDISDEILEIALNRISSSLKMFARHGLIADGEVGTCMDRLYPTTVLEEAVEDASFVVEAAPEELSIKQELFEIIDKIAPDEAILATNTSGFRIGDVSKKVRYKERVVGSHFFLPAQVIPLIEVSRGSLTSDRTMDITIELWKSFGKEPVRLEYDVPGYIANRLQGAIVREATSLLSKGIATAEDIDRAVRISFGLRYLVSGPLEQRDLGGLDLHVKLGTALWPTLDVSPGPHQFVKDMVDEGKLGLKTGQGFIDWSGLDPEEVRESKTEALIKLMSKIKEQD